MNRKRHRRIDDYLDSITNSQEENNQRLIFYESLRMFYRRRWQCPLKLPHIQGVEVDLFKLYETVRSLGGWQKVTSMEKWRDVVRIIGIDENTQNVDYALRLIYMRYLGKYEHAQFGNENDNDDTDMITGRLKIKTIGFGSFSSLSEIPVSVPKSSHISNDTLPNYEKLEASLMSGLPNEVDFAINIITLLSHPGPYVMRFSECQNLITLLVAHCCPIQPCGLFSLEGMRNKNVSTVGIQLLQKAWETQLNYKLTDFWNEAQIRDADLAVICGISASNEEYIEFFDDKLNFQDSINWRVFNILMIFRNLSFEDCNKFFLAKNIHLLRFLMLCMNCRWQSLVNNAFDTLSNIASEIDLTITDAIFQQHLFLKTLAEGLSSPDQFIFLRSVEAFGKLSTLKINEPTIYEFLGPVLDRTIQMLPHKNILCCVTLLESFLEISQLGKRVCDLISEHRSSINVFVKLLTIDAASILNGTKEQNRIKIIQVHGPTAQEQPYVSKRNVQMSQLPPASAKSHSDNHLPASAAHSFHPSLRHGTPMIANPSISESYETSVLPNNGTVARGIDNHLQDKDQQYMCEWGCCGSCFSTVDAVLQHNTYIHLLNRVFPKKARSRYGKAKRMETIVVPSDQTFVCKWPLCSDAVPRALWSMVTHLQERHCNEQYLQVANRKRLELGSAANYLGYLQQQIMKGREHAMTPGYSKFAAIEAIRRNASVNVVKELSDDPEGPVTRSIRLTSSLILRNIAKYSPVGRGKLQKYEYQLSYIAFSRMEAGTVIAQCLSEMTRHSTERATIEASQNTDSTEVELLNL